MQTAQNSTKKQKKQQAKAVIRQIVGKQNEKPTQDNVPNRSAPPIPLLKS